MFCWGIASCNGIESFMRDPLSKTTDRWNKIVLGDSFDPKKSAEEKNAAFQTVYWNRHRHTVLYQVDLDAAVAKEIEELVKVNPVEALILLKEKAKSISIAKMPGAERSWKLIPNPDIDPHGK